MSELIKAGKKTTFNSDLEKLVQFQQYDHKKPAAGMCQLSSFQRTKGSPVSSHRSPLPVKQSRTTTDAFLQTDRALQGENEEFSKGRNETNGCHFIRLTPVSHLHLCCASPLCMYPQQRRGQGWNAATLVVIIPGGEYKTSKTE